MAGNSVARQTLDELGVEWLSDRISAGDTQTAIVNDLGIGIATLGRWISADPERSARVREARISAARAYDDKAQDVLTGACNPFGLAKARELAHHYRWKASKANPREYGEKLEIDQRTTITDLTDEQLESKFAQFQRAIETAKD